VKRFHRKPHSKLGSVWTTYNGQRYQSKREAYRAWELDQLLATGRILRWERPAPIALVIGPTRAETVTYKPDFRVWAPDGTYWYEDVKGFETYPFKLKLNLWRERMPDALHVRYADGTIRIISKGTVTTHA